MSGGRRIKKPAPKAKARAAGKAVRRSRRRRPPPGRPSPAMDLAVGQRIRELRREHKLSLETIAAIVPICRSASSARSNAGCRRLRFACSPRLPMCSALASPRCSAHGQAMPASGGVVTRQVQRAELKLVAHRHFQAITEPGGRRKTASICFSCTWSPAATPATSSTRMTARKLD